MNFEHYGTITTEDIEAARRDVATADRSPEAARKRLISAGVLTQDGRPRWPTDPGRPTAETSKK